MLTCAKALKASAALLKHMKADAKSRSETSAKKSMLPADDEAEDEDETNDTPIWLNLTTKKHIVDKQRLKPGKIALPHSMNTSSTTTICLITADPQRAFKDIVASPAFPAELSSRITRVIGVQKIKAKYGQYEAQRQLFAEHDLFLADDRIITMLPKLLGKTFYSSTTKRPIPVSLEAPRDRTDGKRIARAKSDNTVKAKEPKQMAAEIEKTFSTALIALAPSTCTSVRIGYAGWDAQKITDNVEAVVNGMIEKFVPQKWRGVRAIHIKGPNTAALPIWLADELWVDETEVLEDGPELTEAEIKESKRANIGRKRKAGVEVAAIEPKKTKQEPLAVSTDSLEKEIAQRKEKLKKQKAEAAADVDEDVVPKKAKTSKKRKAVDA